MGSCFLLWLNAEISAPLREALKHYLFGRVKFGTAELEMSRNSIQFHRMQLVPHFSRALLLHAR